MTTEFTSSEVGQTNIRNYISDRFKSRMEDHITVEESLAIKLDGNLNLSYSTLVRYFFCTYSLIILTSMYCLCIKQRIENDPMRKVAIIHISKKVIYI